MNTAPMRGVSQLGGAMRAMNAPSSALSGTAMHANAQPLTGQLRPRPVARPRNSIIAPATSPRRMAPRVPTDRPMQVLGPNAAGRSPSAPTPLVWRVVNASCEKLCGLGFCHDERGLERRLHTRRVLERVQQMAIERGAVNRQQLQQHQDFDREQSGRAMASANLASAGRDQPVTAGAPAAAANGTHGPGRHTKLKKHKSSREESVYQMASDVTGGSCSGYGSDGSRLSERISSSPYALSTSGLADHRPGILAERISSSPYELAKCGRGPLLSGRFSSANSSSSTDPTYEMACVQTALQFQANSNASFNFADATPDPAEDDIDSSSDYDFGSITWLEQGLVASFENAVPNGDSDTDCGENLLGLPMVSGPLANVVVPTKPKKGMKGKTGSGKSKTLLASIFRRRSRTKSAKSMASNV